MDIRKDPQNAFTIDITLPNGDTAYTSPYPTVVIVITTHQMAVK